MKNFVISWQEKVVFRMDIEGKNKKEIEKKFLKGDLDLENNEQGDGEIIDGSLEIEEVK